ncbi:uncharacterized protein TRIADDRAFT_50469 [Trichoplax adhaerens]|uniref:UDP-glucose 4-epimerase n=1 Tax=Trichoplax adhaerens TaxID=10228 RepID=B3S254_TRIAD|nr:hypothetical protein TRIADDRAFT_50469 [Trichoplax adhaerens]EDV23373.1 hypothetical protein TRIADDRAFT_50469 [Trichoplax adhaerens]|eukprot:XP_002114283.1 hypothetical protein TRIADDRAFT_50469 [Trichoplax adhaerens]
MGKDEVLVLGGAGYIGSHTCVELIGAEYKPVIVDNTINSSPVCVSRLQQLTGENIAFYQFDVRDQVKLREVFSQHDIKAVIHFAGLKSVPESVQFPLKYYSVNIGATITLLEVMKEFKVYNLVFSSSSTVYGKPQFLPMTEDHPTGQCTSPYGRTKYFIEEILKDLCVSDPEWNIISLRYFNPVGAHQSGIIGEVPLGIPNNLLPYIAQVCNGKREYLTIYGDDYKTPDGTGIRDYLHVVDLAVGHVLALKKMQGEHGCRAYNLGSGTGFSVKEIIQAFEKASGKKLPCKIAGRRAGDVAASYADSTIAQNELGWKATKNLKEICEDYWNFQSKNPQGYS